MHQNFLKHIEILNKSFKWICAELRLWENYKSSWNNSLHITDTHEYGINGLEFLLHSIISISRAHNTAEIIAPTTKTVLRKLQAQNVVTSLPTSVIPIYSVLKYEVVHENVERRFTTKILGYLATCWMSLSYELLFCRNSLLYISPSSPYFFLFDSSTLRSIFVEYKRELEKNTMWITLSEALCLFSSVPYQIFFHFLMLFDDFVHCNFHFCEHKRSLFFSFFDEWPVNGIVSA